MSRIDDHIKELQLQKKKIKYLNYLVDQVEKSTIKKGFEEFKDTLGKEFLELINVKITSIENGEEVHSSFNSDNLTAKEIDFVRTLIKRTQQKKQISKQEQKESKKPLLSEVPKLQNEDTMDPLSFSLKYKYLYGKLVQLDSGAHGKVVGAVVPNIIVKLDDGRTANIKPNKLKIVS